MSESTYPNHRPETADSLLVSARHPFSKHKRWLVHFAVFMCYVVLAVFMTWPGSQQLDTHFLGQNIDLWINLWPTWWTRKVLTEGIPFYTTHFMFYPVGTSLVFHSFSHVNTIFELIAGLFTSPLAAYNLSMLASLPLSGFTMYCLVTELTRSRRAGFFSGLVFAFYPYRMAEIVHPVLVSTQWMPLYLLFVFRWLNRRNWRSLGFATLAFLLTALTSWHLMLFNGFITCCLFAYKGLFTPREQRMEALKRLVILSFTLGIFTLPFIAPLLKEHLTVNTPYMGVELEGARGNDIAAFVLPAEQHPVFGDFTIPYHALTKNTRAAYVGLSVVILCVIALIRNWRHARFWVFLILLSLAMSMHPHPRLWGREMNFLLPWSIPIVRILRHPFRFNIVIGLGLSICAGMGFAALNRKHRASTLRGVTIWQIALCMFLLFEYMNFPFPLTEAYLPPFYQETALSSEDGAILDLPMGKEPSRYYLFYQMMHQQPIMEGIVSRTPQTAYTYIENEPVLRSIRDCGPSGLPLADMGSLYAALNHDIVRQVIIHKSLLSSQVMDTWTRLQVSDPLYEDKDLIVYAPPALPIPKENHLLEGCLSVRPTVPVQAEVQQGTVISVTLEWFTGSVPEEHLTLELSLKNKAADVAQHHWYQIFEGGSITSWHPGKQHVVAYPFHISSTLPPGTYECRARLLPLARHIHNPLSAVLGEVAIAASEQPTVVSVTDGIHVDVIFDHAVELEHYQLYRSADTLRVILHWQALAQNTREFKTFVHVYNAQGDLVSQMDTFPQEWTFNTNIWGQHVRIRDEISLPLSALQPGQYTIGLGLYEFSTGYRLPISSSGENINTAHDIAILDQFSIN